MAANPYGQICWLEVPVTSVSRAAKFYSSTLGWESKDTKGGPSPIAGVKSAHLFSNGTLHGAFLLMSDQGAIAQVADPNRLEKSALVATFLVESIEETMTKIEAAGGKCHIPKTAVGGGMGYLARFIDTEGNLAGIWAKQ